MTKPQIPFSELPDDALVRLPQFLGTVVPSSRATWYKWMAEGRAPQPVRLSPRMVAWRAGTVREWLRAQAATA